MGVWFERLLLTLATTVLEKLASKAIQEWKEAAERAAQAKEDLATGEHNAKAYRESKTRAERIQNALNLLNDIPPRVSGSPKVSP